MRLVALLFAMLFLPASLLAQQKLERVDFYISPYANSVEADPLGDILGRIDMRLEFRADPLISHYFEVEYQRNLNKISNGIVTHAYSFGVGERIYLRDNAAMVGLYAGANLGLSVVNSSALDARLSIAIGYKLTFGSRSNVFIEPEMLIDSYVIKHANMNLIFPYIAIPIGVLW